MYDLHYVSVGQRYSIFVVQLVFVEDDIKFIQNSACSARFHHQVATSFNRL